MADKPPHDGMIIAIICVLVGVGLSVLLWLGMSEQISSGVRWIRVGELKIISLFTDRYDLILKQVMSMRPDQITPYYILKMTEVTNGALRLPISIIFALMAIFCFFKKEKHPFTRKLNLEGITKEQAEAFPVVSPMVKFNPLAANSRTMGAPVPEKLPSFAEALIPEEWVSYQSISVVDGVIDTDQARRAFAKQLGGRWKGVNALPIYAQALFAAFSMKANGRRVESDDFLGEVAACWYPGRGLVLTPQLRGKIKDIISDPKMGRITEKVAAQHAFVVPALLRCLQVAREQGGVLAPAQFLWLRGVDRSMWYPLNNLGRGAVHTEAAGALAHFRAERAAGKPIPNPQMDSAVEGLAFYLKDNDITTFPAKSYGRG